VARKPDDTARGATRFDNRSFDPEERIELLLGHLGTGVEGLPMREAARRLAQHGPNQIERRAGKSRLAALVEQFVHPLALLLWVAAALAVVGGIRVLALAIVAVIVLNAVFAFVQELQAERATEALQEFLPPTCRVRRGGRTVEVAASEIVPGDLLLVSEGDRVPADARIISGSLEVDLSALTGESQPVARGAIRSQMPAAPIQSEDLLFSGTLATAGEAEAVVYATGMATQLGRIAALTQRVREKKSPLQRQVDRAAWLISLIAVIAGVLFLAVGTLLAGLPVYDALIFSIGLLVANVPEGLLPTITLALAVGVRRMAKRRALLKRMTAVETLGSTDVICTDKTGTLTRGKMKVVRLWAAGEELVPEPGLRPKDPIAALLRTAVRCSNATVRRTQGGWEESGDPSESALLVAAAELGEDVEEALAGRERVRSRLYHFDAKLKRMTTADIEPGGHLYYHTKGAPVELLERCTTVREAAGDRQLGEEERAGIVRVYERYASEGLRVLAFAERRSGTGLPEERELAESGLTFLGFAALEDPPREDVPEAVVRCRNAGIRIIVVTGDSGLTAVAIARRVGIVRGEPAVVTGPEIDAMPEPALDALLKETPELIVARSNPETKLHVVEALRAEGYTVAMTGDGVNDAPALKQADIGVAMGRSGTGVAREAATMVLTDDNFASIVAAIEEGRTVFDNIRKFITYIFAHLTPEAVPFLLYALSGGAIPLPLTVLQILAIDLGTETLPALALGREPAEPGIMERPPRPREQGILDRAMLVRAWVWLGVVEAVLVMSGFFYVLLAAGWTPGAPVGPGSSLHEPYLAATTMTFAGITACQVGTAFAARTERASLRSIGVLSNRLLLWGILFEIVFAAAIIYLPPLQGIFHTAALGWTELSILATFPFVVWGADELRRWALRRRSSAANG
jgi:calcium-translocating P-type ATPase